MHLSPLSPISYIFFLHCYVYFFILSLRLSPPLVCISSIALFWPLLTDSFWRQQCKSLSGSPGTTVPLPSPAQPALWWTQAPPEWPHCRQKAKFALGIGSGLHQTRYKTSGLGILDSHLHFSLSPSLLLTLVSFYIFSGTMNPCSIDSPISVILPIFKYSLVFSLSIHSFYYSY